MSDVGSPARLDTAAQATTNGAAGAVGSGSHNPTTIADLFDVIRADAHRYDLGLARLLLLERVFRHIVVLRLNAFLRVRRGPFARIARVPALLYWYRARTLGFDISPGAEIGGGLYVDPHPGGVVVHSDARLGRNCNLHHGVTIGRKHRGRQKGVPSVGDNVWIGPGAKLIGAITVGSHAVVGPNCVVSEDVPSGGVLAAQRPRLIGMAGSEGYVERPI